MINSDLVKYIQAQKSGNSSREDIAIKLLQAGWTNEDIKENLDSVFVSIPPVTPPVTPAVAKVAPIIPTESSLPTMPNLMPKVQGPAGARPIPFVASNPNPSISTPEGFRPVAKKPDPTPTVDIMSSGPLPHSAVISSYKKDYQNANPEGVSSGFHWGRLLLIILLVIILGIGGTVFAYTKGLINLPFDIPFLTPTPEQAMVKMMNNFSKTQTSHYSTDIEASLAMTETTTSSDLVNTSTTPSSLPPTTNTTTSKLKIHIETDIDNTDTVSPKSSSVFNVSIVLFEGFSINIDSELRVINDISYLKIPDMAFASEFVGEPNTWLSFTKSDLEELSKSEDDLPISVPATYDEAKVKAMQDLFQDTKFTNQLIKVGTEKVDGKSTHHYQITIAKESIKSFVVKAMDILDDPSLNLNREEIISQLDSIEKITGDMWLAKGSYALRKFTFVLSTNDIKIGESSSVKTDLTVSSILSKFNEPVSIFIPDKTHSMSDKLKSMRLKSKDASIKAVLQSMRVDAELFFDDHKNSYGKSNSSGSCIAPVQGSLFENSDTLISLLKITNNTGSCYSNTKGYAVSVPLASDPTIMWCVDNTGAMIETKVPLKGTICK